MNPLCCIAPVSIDRDRNNNSNRLGFDSSLKTIGFGSKLCFPAQISSISSTDLDFLRQQCLEVEDTGVNVNTTSVGGILYKWVIGEDSVKHLRKANSINHRPDRSAKQWKPFREIHLKGIKDETTSGLASVGFLRNGHFFETVKVKHVEKGVDIDWVMRPNWSRAPENAEHCSQVVWQAHYHGLPLLEMIVSSVCASKSDDKRLSMFTGTKMLHLRCVTREDRTAWIEALQAAKDFFPIVLSSNDFGPSENILVSTEKLRLRLLQEGIGDGVIRDREAIMLAELSELQNQLTALQRKHVTLLDTLRQLEAEKRELEPTVVDETKEHESYCGQGNRRFIDFYSIMSEGTASDFDADNVSQDGVDVESVDDDGIFFDANDFLVSDSLRSASYWSRENTTNAFGLLANDKDSFFFDRLNEVQTGIREVKYPSVKRRDNLPEPKEKEKPVGLLSIIKDNIGKDLSGVCVPVYFNEPPSSLQKCFEEITHIWLIEHWNGGNDLMRILNIAAFAVSGYASTEGRQCKPFNPLLGDFCFPHHPTIVACHCEGRGWKFWGRLQSQRQVQGRSIQLDPVGALTLQFEDGETFQWSKVTTSIHNIILGKIYCDHYGTMRIRGSGNFSCKLKFKEQSIIDRNPHQVHGVVQDNRTGEKLAMLVGKWDEAMYYVLGDSTTKPKGYDPMTEAVLLWERGKSIIKTRYNLSPFAISLNELTPGLLELLPPTDSRLRPDQSHLENGEYELANAEKLRLEQLQRQARKMQERGWQTRWFRKDKEDGTYRYIGGYWEAREKKNWDGNPDIFGQGTGSPSRENSFSANPCRRNTP
ncbi:Oxysterol-binding protein [Dillenia turbinata]|uniref:Oxysterol-binding protein n=1 Tax=Dillenia turbinata TaxID=194707 RepID=A0AAN8ZAN9_9MAGN